MIQVIDVFAGPGGLNEGFSSVEDANGNPVFKVAASFEMEQNAVNTLVLRAAMRRLRSDGSFHRDYYRFLNGDITETEFRALPHVAEAIAAARSEVHQVELGPGERENVTATIQKATAGAEHVVLIGGPPCQAYSLVGRARRKHDQTFLEDKKHFLYREYLDILQTVKPTVFVMENVKGLLSASHGDTQMVDLILDDLTVGGDYEIRSLVVPTEHPRPTDFVIRAEQYGVPQARHRVILLGLRKDAHLEPDTITPTAEDDRPDLIDAISGLPAMRARLTPRSQDNERDWELARAESRLHAGVKGRVNSIPPVGRAHVAATAVSTSLPESLRRWLLDDNLRNVTLHEPRAHMRSDLVRYGYLALMKEQDETPRVTDLPRYLRPAHKNVDAETTPFTDRFKVQGPSGPSSTIVSHMAKDGHHFIHPDADQMRSLTVREAARLQTFPDNYWFTGSRTAQYQQVGNAVPPYLAHQIARVVAKTLGHL